MKHKLLMFFVVNCLLITTVFAQERVISGTVNSSEGGPIENVSVRTGRVATQTDAQGRFTIQAATGATLTFTAVGFSDVTATVGTSNTINVVLTPATQEIDEVIVVGYGTVRRSDFTGSALTVTSKDLDKRPISNPLVALQGAGPGVQTTTPGGGPGSSPGIMVRGIGSYSAGTGPLYVVDGVEFTGGFGNINPEDVESISVLKDAATIAIFGSRGANGVVVVTTKKGGGDRPRLDAKVGFGFNQNGDPGYDVVNQAEYYELMWESYKNSMQYSASNPVPADIAAQIASGRLERNANGMQVYDGRTYSDIVQYVGGYNVFNVPNTELIGIDGKINPSAQLRFGDDLDWLNQASQNGKRNEYNLTFSNSVGNRTDLYASLNFLDEEGWGLRSTMDRYAGRLNVNSQINNWLKAGVNLFANYNTYNSAATGASSINNPFLWARGTAPIYPVHLWDPVTGQPVYDDLGNHRFDLGNHVAEFGLNRNYRSGRHAIAESLWNMDRSTRDFVGARAYVDFNILPSLTFSVNLSPEITNTRGESYENTEVGDGAPAGRYSQDWSRTFGYTFNQLVRYNETFKDVHNFNALLGHESFSRVNTGVGGMRTGQGFQNFFTYTNFTDIANLSSSLSERAMESYFSRVEYDYDQMYYLFGSLRYDGDSRFPKANRWSPFWSMGAAWRMSGESWFNAEWVSDLKFRTSYGRLGNSDVGTYPYQAGYAIGINNAAAPGTVLSALGSPDLKWEGQRSLTIAADFSLFNHRLIGSFDYYKRTSDGLLFSIQQPYHNGGTTGGSFVVRRNVGDLENKGIELQLTGQLIRREDFNWSMTLNVTTMENTMVTLPDEFREDGIVSGSYKIMEGRSRYDFYTRSFYGVDPDNGRVLYKGVTEGSYSPTNEDIIIRGNDTLTYNQNIAKLDYIGKSALPKAYGSLSNNLSYKNFEFGFVLQYSVGGYAMDSQYSGYMSPGSSTGGTYHRDLLNGWRKPGDITDIPRMDLNQTAQFGATSDRWLERSDYLNISSVNVGYRFSNELAARLGMRNMRVYVSAENLGYVTTRKGFNTLSGFTGSAGSGSYSFARTVNFGLNFGL